MHSTLELRALSAVAGFLLQTATGWLVCLLLARLAASSHRRFQIWLSMILVFAARWIWIWAALLFPRFPAPLEFVQESAIGSLASAHAVAFSAQWAEYLPHLLRGLICCYFGGILLLALRAAVRRNRLLRAMEFRITPSPTLQALFDASARRMSLRGCRLWVLPGLVSPATLGWWRPQILLPSLCEGQDATELQEAFWHELKHVERRDALWEALSNACRVLLWFHPGVHSAVTAMSMEREIACDRAVVQDHPQSRDVYAACLLRFARLAVPRGPVATGTLELTSAAALLDVRVRSILVDAPPLSRRSRSSRTAGSLLLLGVAIAAAPALRVFLELQPSFTPALPSFISAAAGYTSPGKRPRVKSHIQTKRRGGPVAAPTIGSDVPAIHPEADPKLAAEHRAGMAILTERTMGDEDASSQQNKPADSSWQGRAPEHSAPPLSLSWTSVALGAAQHVGSLAGGGEQQDHEGR